MKYGKRAACIRSIDISLAMPFLKTLGNSAFKAFDDKLYSYNGRRLADLGIRFANACLSYDSWKKVRDAARVQGMCVD